MASFSIHANNALNAPPTVKGPTPSVNHRADNVLEIASSTHAYAANLLSELRQLANGPQEGESPCRAGIDGKLTDAAEHSEATMVILQEIRQYLLG